MYCFFAFNSELRTLNFELNFRSAGGAGIRLRMEPPVTRVIIFSSAIRAHRKTCHGGVRTVVGHRTSDRVSRSTVCAIDEWIKITAVRRVEQFPQAVIAD